MYRCVKLAAHYLFPSGRDVQVTVGKVTEQQKLNPLSLKDVQIMSSKAHLTGVQQESILADIRSKWGKKVVKPGLQKGLPEHNMKYAKISECETSGGDLVMKDLFVRASVHLPVRPSVSPSVRPFVRTVACPFIRPCVRPLVRRPTFSLIAVTL